MNQSEAIQNEALQASLQSLIADLQKAFLQEHHLNEDGFSDARQSLITGYTSAQLHEALAGMGIELLGGVGPAATFVLPHEDGAERVEQVLWLDSQNADINGLRDLNQANFEQHLQGLLMVAEEVSHMTYIQSYFTRYRNEPPHWLQEMIGALDKYVFVQKKYTEVKRRLMAPAEEQRVFRDIFRAVNNPHAPEEHQVGQEYAYRALSHLNNLAKSGRLAEANALESSLYSSDENGVLALFAQ